MTARRRATGVWASVGVWVGVSLCAALSSSLAFAEDSSTDTGDDSGSGDASGGPHVPSANPTLTPAATATSPTTTRPPLDPRLRISGDLVQHHKVVVDVTGPDVHEDQDPTPFLQYRLDATFTLRGGGTGTAAVAVTVPGFYAADGNAAHTSASAGNVWRKFESANADTMAN